MLLGNEIIDISKDSIIEISLGSSSKGNQRKFYDNETHSYIKEAFYYQGKFWKDAYVEHLAWRLSTMTDTLGIKIVKQDVVRLDVSRTSYDRNYGDGIRYGCKSPDFLYYDYPEHEWMSAARAFRVYPSYYFGKSFKVFSELKSLYQSECNIDITDYLVVMILFDYLLGNEDRHYNNFGVLRNCKTGKFMAAPLFDFGLGLFEHDLRYQNKSLFEAMAMMEGKPFDSDLEKPVQMLCNNTITKKKVETVFEGIHDINKELFPNELAYRYYEEAVESIKEMLKNV